MKERLLTFQEPKDGIQQATLNISTLYPDKKERKQFEERLQAFLESPSAHPKIFQWTYDRISYQTECIIPEKPDSRPPLLLVFGNPASHSVNSGMFFSYEGKDREHRIWKMLSEGKILSFSSTVNSGSIAEANRLRKRELLYGLCYESPFGIGFTVYYTFPSPASGIWAGVGGLKKLFRKDAFTKIGECEKSRIDGIIRKFVSPNGAVIAFQKDAYLAIKSSESPDYKLEEAKAGNLGGKWHCDSDIRLFCHPPTRQRNPNLRFWERVFDQCL